jgi:hypothetical protein
MHHLAVVLASNGDIKVYKDGGIVDGCALYSNQWDGRIV